MKARSIYVVVLLGLFLTVGAQGQSSMINYQGKLTDAQGEPLNATVSVQFSIYGQASGGLALWIETQSTVVVANGIFNVLLGSVNPIPFTLFDGSARWLGLKVGSDAEMSPRQQIVSVGYALRASDADKVDGQHASDFLSTASDWGRPGVATDLYEGNTQLNDKYVNETGPEEMTGTSNDPIVTVINSGNGYGVYGRHQSSGNFGYLGSNSYGLYALSGNGTGVSGASESGTGVNGYGSTGYGVYGSSMSGTAVYYSGGLAGTGSKSCIVKTSKGPAYLYCQESPENWFEDFGEGRLSGGRCHIELDPLFLETVTINDRNPMKVFIQLNGNCNGTYVERGGTGFDVIELGGGQSNAQFTYRVVAKRKGFEDKRLDVCETAKKDPYLYPELKNTMGRE